MCSNLNPSESAHSQGPVRLHIPEQVKLGGFVYTITLDDTVLEELGACGAVNHERLDMRLAGESDLSPQQTRLSLLHESVHAVAQVYGAGTGEDLLEAWVEAISNGLFQVLNDNPDVVRFVLDAGSSEGNRGA